MAQAAYLIDTSVLARLSKTMVAEAVAGRLLRGEVAVSGPVLFEVGYSARTSVDREEILDHLRALPYVDTVEADQKRASEIQGELASLGAHRGLSLVDALVAAAAERVTLTVLHYDADYERISAVTGQPHEWVVARGSAD